MRARHVRDGVRVRVRVPLQSTLPPAPLILSSQAEGILSTGRVNPRSPPSVTMEIRRLSPSRTAPPLLPEMARASVTSHRRLPSALSKAAAIPESVTSWWIVSE